MPKVNPAILIWARETAGLSLEDAARKLAVSAERLALLESGERDPTRRQLANMSEKYRRPLLTFYLPEPPKVREKGQDFRTLPGGRLPESEPLLDALLRDVQIRQQLVRAALEETEEDEPLSFVGSADQKAGVDALVISIRKILNISLDEFRAQRTITEAFAKLRAAVERAGVFVVLMGNLGTHHTDVDVSVFRGFALADQVAPFIVINEKDSRAAWSFTLIHELAHIFLGQTGISGYDGEAEIEKFCDSIASRFLLDPGELLRIPVNEAANIESLKDMVGNFSARRNLSRKMVAYNLLRTRLITVAVYRELSDAFDAERAAERVERPRDNRGPDYYIVRRHRIGPGLVSLVKRMVAGGALSTTKAGKVLGVKPTAVDRLIKGHEAA